MANIIDHLISAHQLILQNEREVFLALAAIEEGHDLPDASVASFGLWAGCTHAVNFDRKASRLPGMKLI